MITGFKLDCPARRNSKRFWHQTQQKHDKNFHSQSNYRVKSLSSDEAYTAKRNKSNVPKELASNDIQTTKNRSFLRRLHSSVSTVYRYWTEMCTRQGLLPLWFSSYKVKTGYENDELPYFIMNNVSSPPAYFRWNMKISPLSTHWNWLSRVPGVLYSSEDWSSVKYTFSINNS